jgi:hypothetical protein
LIMGCLPSWRRGGRGSEQSRRENTRPSERSGDLDRTELRAKDREIATKNEEIRLLRASVAELEEELKSQKGLDKSITILMVEIKKKI